MDRWSGTPAGRGTCQLLRRSRLSVALAQRVQIPTHKMARSRRMASGVVEGLRSFLWSHPRSWTWPWPPGFLAQTEPFNVQPRT